jgi:hypothetical protein
VLHPQLIILKFNYFDLSQKTMPITNKINCYLNISRKVVLLKNRYNITYTFRRIMPQSYISQETIIEVAEYGIVTLLNADTLSEWVFYLASAHWVKKAIKFNQQLTNRLGSNGYGY